MCLFYDYTNTNSLQIPLEDRSSKLVRSFPSFTSSCSCFRLFCVIVFRVCARVRWCLVLGSSVYIIIVAYVMVVDMVVVTPFLFYLFVQRSRMDASEGFCRSQCIGISSGDGSWTTCRGCCDDVDIYGFVRWNRVVVADVCVDLALYYLLLYG